MHVDGQDFGDAGSAKMTGYHLDAQMTVILFALFRFCGELVFLELASSANI